MGKPKPYDFKRHTVSFGPIVFNMYADGDDVVRVSEANDRFSLEVGADGRGTRIRMNDKSGSFEVDLAYTSPANQLLTAIAETDARSPNGDGILPFIVKDWLGGTLHMAQSAWIRAVPKDSIGKKPGKRTWIFDTDEITSNFGNPA